MSLETFVGGWGNYFPILLKKNESEMADISLANVKDRACWRSHEGTASVRNGDTSCSGGDRVKARPAFLAAEHCLRTGQGGPSWSSKVKTKLGVPRQVMRIRADDRLLLIASPDDWAKQKRHFVQQISGPVKM